MMQAPPRTLFGFLFGLAASMAMAVLPAVAQQTAPLTPDTQAPAAVQTQAPQVLTLDQDRLYGTSLYGKALEAKSLVATQALAAENRKIEADLSAEEATLTTQRATLTAEAFAPLADAFDVKVERIRAEQEVKARQLATDRDAGRKKFFDAAVPVLAELMREMGAYAILNRSAVVLSFDTIDITTRAIAELDLKLGDGSALAPTP